MTFHDDFDAVILSPSHGGATGTIVALCFHDTEGGGTARNVGQFFANPNTQASTTGVFSDTDSCGCVPYNVTAWHSGAGSPWNGAIEGYEHVGFAAWSRDQWLAHGPMLDRSARHYAKRCQALGIPPRKINADQLARAIATRNPADGGICGHYDITLAAGVYGGHTDPGPEFPWDHYIDLVRHYHGGAAAASASPTTPEPEEIDVPTIIRIKTKAGEYLYDPCAGTARNISGDESAVLQAAPFSLPKHEFDAGSAMHRILNGDGTTITKLNYAEVG